MPNDSSKIGRHALSTVASSSLGIVTGVLLDAIIMGIFGLGSQSDAYFIAITIPLVAITIMSLQASRVFQPLFISKREREGEKQAWSFLSLMITNDISLIGALSLVAVLASPLLIRLQTIGSTSAVVAQSTKLSVLFFLILPLYSSIAIMRVALNSLEVFALPGAMKFIENSFKILFVILLGGRFGVFALVLGMFAGAVSQICIFYMALRKKGYRFRPRFDFHHPDLTQVYRLMLFPLTGQFLALLVELINNSLGSMLGAGNVSALRLATRIIESFGGLLAGSIVIAAMPAIASNLSNRDLEGAKKSLRQGLYLLLLVTVPLSTWLAFTNRALIGLIYERMNFSAADTALVANILLVMIPYIFLARLLGLLELPFFATHDTKTPLLGSILYTALYITIALLSISVLGIYALPLSRSLSYLAASLFLLQFLRRRIGKMGFSSLRDSLAKILWATLIMGLLIFIGAKLSRLMPASAYAAKVIALCLPSFAGSVALVAALVFLRLVDPGIVKRAFFSLCSSFKSASLH